MLQRETEARLKLVCWAPEAPARWWQGQGFLLHSQQDSWRGWAVKMVPSAPLPGQLRGAECSSG